MIKTISIVAVIFLGLLIHLHAQTNIKLKVGDKAPAINAYRWVKGKKIDYFQKGKTYVVEFGATWCKPCAEMIPHLTAIAKSNPVNVEVISFFVMEYNPESKITGEAKYVQGVRDFVVKQGDKMNYTIAVDDPEKTLEYTWLKAAGRAGIPISFVVDRDGMIAWIGNNRKGLSDIVKDVSGDHYNLAEYVTANKEYLATTPPFDETKLLLVDGNGGNDSDFIYRSVLTKYKGPIHASGSQYVNSFSYAQPGSRYEHLMPYRARIQEIGVSLSYMYYMAYSDTLWNTFPKRDPLSGLYPDTLKQPYLKKTYGKFWYKPLIEVKDKGPFLASNTSDDNRYNYSLKIPLEKNTAKELQAAMQRDLKTYFGYNVSVETRMMPCWKLIRTDSSVEVMAKTITGKYESEKLNDSTYLLKNIDIRDLIDQMGGIFGPDHNLDSSMEEAPFLDFTGIKGEINYMTTIEEHRLIRREKNWDAINKFYARLGMKWIKGAIPMKVVVIKDQE